MNAIRLFLAAAFACACAGLASAADLAPSADLASAADLAPGIRSFDLSRERMLESSRTHTTMLAYASTLTGEIGDWKDTIDAVLFLLLRKTELDRGSIRVLATDALEFPARWYPDGTFAVSTELLDYIDYAIYERTSSSGRRIRDIGAEREAMLAPFLAYEAARLAGDACYAAWVRTEAGDSFTTRTRESFEETAAADRYARVLLSLAGYDPSLADGWLELLADPQSFALFQDLAAWQALLPDPATRSLYFARAAETDAVLAEELSGILQALASGTALKEADFRLGELTAAYQGNLHILTLAALTAHRLWISTASAEELGLPVFLPYARETDSLSASFASLLQSKNARASTPLSNSVPVQVPGNPSLHARSRKDYEAVLGIRFADPIAASYASLMVWSPDPALRRQAVEISRTAALREAEENSSDFIARAVHAQLLFLTGADYDQAQSAMDELIKRSSSWPTTQRTLPLFLARGMSGDTRDLVLSRGLMSRTLGDSAKAAECAETLRKALPEAGSEGAKLSFRGLRLGDSTDALAALWGKPASIIYTWYTENWQYPRLGASVLVGSENGSEIQSVKLVRLHQNSVVSPLLAFPGGNAAADFPQIRTGDGRKEFEAAFGQSLWRSGDCEAYAAGEGTLLVLFLDGRIRSIRAQGR